MPIAIQLVPHVPALAAITDDRDMVARFNEVVFSFLYAFWATTFDIEDTDIEQAEATHARNLTGDPELRADDMRFATLVL